MGETVGKAATVPSLWPSPPAEHGGAAGLDEVAKPPDPAAATPSLPSAAPVGTPALQLGEAKSPPHKLWTLPARGLAVFHGGGETARLSHYFLPRLLLQGKRVLMLDGANCANPRLLERLARQRGMSFREFSRRMQIARAFTCFQLTELLARVPRFRADFPAEVLIVTAFPDLYFDEDVRDWDARVAFEQALAHLQRYASPFTTARSAGLQPGKEGVGRNTASQPGGAGLKAAATLATLPLAVALFSAAATFVPSPARRSFFARVRAAATEVWKFDIDAGGKMGLTSTRSNDSLIG
jgi:hypothetical protein